MRVILTGDRNWHAPDLAEKVRNRLLLRYGPGLVIVHGGATGIDRSFAEACGDLGVEQEADPARWEELDHPVAVIRFDGRNRPYNANAGPIRKAAMVAAGAETCLTFHRAITGSKGMKTVFDGQSRPGIRPT